MDLVRVQKNIGYYFKDIRLLRTALVHRSYLNEKDKLPEITEHNERLEFLGDAVLELIVTEYLYLRFNEPEGYLTSLRSALVNYKTLGKIGQKLGLDEEILISKGEREELGKARLTIVADAMEAVIGAIYLDSGMEACREFVKQFVFPNLEDIVQTKAYKDAKTLLQEFTQKHYKTTPLYKLLFTEGKDHEKIFYVGVWINKEKMAEASGKSKQEAETKAAQIVLEQLQTNNSS